MDTNVKGAERTLAHLSMFLWFGIMLLYFENNGTMKALLSLSLCASEGQQLSSDTSDVHLIKLPNMIIVQQNHVGLSTYLDDKLDDPGLILKPVFWYQTCFLVSNLWYQTSRVH